DGCMDQKLIKEGAQSLEGVYLTYPLTASAYGDSGHSIYGSDAREIVSQLIESSERRFRDLAGDKGGISYQIRRLFGIRRVSDARNAVTVFMESAVRSEHSFHLSNNQEAKFRDDGSRIGGLFSVWKIAAGRFVDCEVAMSSI